MKISEFKIRMHNALDGFIDTYFGDVCLSDRLINSTMKILLKTNINKFDNILNLFTDENGEIDAQGIMAEYAKQLGDDGFAIDIRNYISNDFIKSLMPEKMLIIKKDDLLKMMQ